MSIFLFLILFSIIAYLIGKKKLIYPHRTTFTYYKKNNKPYHPSHLNLPYEEIDFELEKNLNTKIWLIKNPNSKKIVIYLHGVEESKLFGLPYAKFLYENNFNVVLFDFRRHGNSNGKFCTYGFYEKYDVKKIIDFILQRNDFQNKKIALMGISMGAAIAIQTAVIDDRISCMIAENSFTTLRKIFDDYQRRIIKLPFHYLRNLVFSRCEKIANFNSKQISPIEDITNLKIPILFIASQSDDRIAPKYSEELYEKATCEKEILRIENANHINAIDVEKEKYISTVISFLDKNLK